ncbi:MAG: murein transglycosylase A [Acetobacteraceae bacterium]
MRGPGLLLGLALSLAACAIRPEPAGPRAASGTEGLRPVSFAALAGWQQDDPARSLAAFVTGCGELLYLPPDQALGGAGRAAALGGKAGDWTAACLAARAVRPADEPAARAYFAAWFQPYEVEAGGAARAEIGGTYEPEAAGALSESAVFHVPLLARPRDLVRVDPAAMAPAAGGSAAARPIIGRLEHGRLVPYYTRAEIAAGALRADHLAIAWLADPVAAYLMQVEGFGRVRLADGQVLRVGFAGQNGRPYVPIGKVMAARGMIGADAIDLAHIRAWLAAHPALAQGVLDANPNYVFFRLLGNLPRQQGAPGALGVPLTPRRSLAVDRAFIPLGAPVFLVTTDPLSDKPWRRLMVAQDLSGSARGALRADVYFGWGRAASRAAGRPPRAGRLYLLLPRQSPRPAGAG